MANGTTQDPPGFRVSARTILQLGAELISSDAVAFYELIKNAFDARSPSVQIAVLRRLPYGDVEAARELLLEAQGEADVETLAGELVAHVDIDAPRADALRAALEGASSVHELLDVLDGANHILIKDSGEGMTEGDLREIYLTIGTPHRLLQKEASNSGTPILGEKGIGRLSAMRLGHRLEVRTSESGEPDWNELAIDWRWFEDPTALLESIPVAPTTGDPKGEPDASGTTLEISALKSEWSQQKLADISRDELSKLTDPFATKKVRYPIELLFNGERVVIPRFDKILFENAHATVRATYSIKGETPKLSGSVSYRPGRREEERTRSFSLSGVHLASVASEFESLLSQPRSRRVKKEPRRLSPEEYERIEDRLRSLGPFELDFFWFNRQRLRGLDGIGELSKVRELVNEWSGGIKLYRDGFRVLPYGGPNDDWLKLDEKAYGRSGFKGNRNQIIGRVAVSSDENPALRDQTNREGLQDTPEQQTLVALLRYVYDKEFIGFIDQVDKEIRMNREPTLRVVSERIAEQEEKMEDALRRLRAVPEVSKDRSLVKAFEEVMRDVRAIMAQARELGEAFEQRTGDVINLAGIGLMVEVITHELHRATTNTLVALGDVDLDGDRDQLAARLRTLNGQLRTLEKRISVLDPYTTSGRQRKTEFDLVEVIRDVVRSHEAQFDRHQIQADVTGPPGGVPVRAVQGMVVQVLENLISNSVYWLSFELNRRRGEFVPRIDVEVVGSPPEVRFTDNGPGIPPDLQYRVFEPFFSTKSSGRTQKGLGLYVSREIARYHGGDLVLGDALGDQGNLNTFVLTLSSPTSDRD